MDERRKFRRINDLDLEILMRAVNSDSSFRAELKDVSIGGMRIRTNEAVDMYGFYSIDIRFCYEGEMQTVSAEGKVWRIEPDTEMNDDKSRFAALEFTSFAEGNRALFSKFLAGFILRGEAEI